MDPWVNTQTAPPVNTRFNPHVLKWVVHPPQNGIPLVLTHSQMEPLVDENMDDLICGPIPGGLILTHAHLVKMLTPGSEAVPLK